MQRYREDSKIVINSFDMGERLEAENLNEFLSDKSKFGLFQSLLHVIQPKFGFDLFINSDFPVGSVLEDLLQLQRLLSVALMQ